MLSSIRYKTYIWTYSRDIKWFLRENICLCKIKSIKKVGITSSFKFFIFSETLKNYSLYINLYLYINLACLFVCLYPINVKTAEPIGPKFFVRHHVTTGKVYEWSKFQIFVSIKIRSSLIFENFENLRNFLRNPRIIFVLFYDVHKENMFTINLEDGREAPIKASIYIYFNTF